MRTGTIFAIQTLVATVAIMLTLGATTRGPTTLGVTTLGVTTL